MTDWRNLDPQDWPHTPSLDVYAEMAREIPNLFWYLSEGDHLNLLDEAIEKLEGLGQL